MTYKINKKEVTLKQFKHELTLQILTKLEDFEAMDDSDLLECESSIWEITQYVNSINEQITDAKKRMEEEDKLNKEHERIESAMVYIGLAD